MKYIKTYENLKEPKVGYYVIMKNKFPTKPELKDFLENNIGFISNIYYNHSLATQELLDFDLAVIYDWVPEELKKHNFRLVQGGWLMNFNEKHIIEFAKTKKELKLKIQMRKYNI